MIAQTCRDEMRALAALYTATTGSSLSAISRKYYGKSGFLPRFVAGDASMSIDKYDRIMGQIRDDLTELAAKNGDRRHA